MKIIGLDIGTVRIGVAKADSKVKIAVPAGMIPVDGEELDAIARLARVYGTSLFVLGLPRSNSGFETKQSAYVRDFAESLKAKIPGAHVYFQDESLTSVTAKERLNSAGKAPETAQAAKKRRKSGDVDAEAAVIILQDFLEHFAEKVGAKLPKEAKKNTSKVREKAFRPKKRLKKALIIIILTLILLGSACGGALLAYVKFIEPLEPSLGCEACSGASDCVCGHSVSVSVPDGASTSQIADQLEQAGLIRSVLVFQIFTKLNGFDGSFKPGAYTFNTNMSVEEIAQALQTGAKAEVFRITFLPGGTVADAKARLLAAGYSESEISAAFAAAYDHPVLAGRPDGASLEGYLYGETYEFYVGESVQNIIIRLLDQLYSVVQANDLETQFAAQGLSLYQGITLASIVQKEARSADMPTVAQVFLKRLRQGIPLGSDVTTQYALDLVDPDRTTYTSNQAALQVQECHNTRLYAGLPCGPISNPGLTALLAVAAPSATDYLYFLTGDDGTMYYNYTESQHNAAIKAHCQVLCKVSL